ncbi:hypothetical protein QIU19_01245 [Capnocytophaga canimorsus]|nr:hypothetical protein [Capnocytophaga canimorsus]WGU68643.1 hypothetical protein QIU19_01245 [Capnocytophaga canimorsus]
MKRKVIKLFLPLGLLLFLSSCSPKITGTWQVSRYETYTPEKQGVILSNIGTIKLDRDGSGEQHLTYSIFGVTHDEKSPLSWKRKGRRVVIGGNYSEFARNLENHPKQKENPKMGNFRGRTHTKT